MQGKALGLLEFSGWASTLAAADAALKAANVQFIGYELSKGNGWVVLKVQGDVGAVQAAIAAGKEAGLKIGGSLHSALVIPRPHAELFGVTKPPVVLEDKIVLSSDEDSATELESVEEPPDIKEEIPTVESPSRSESITTTKNPRKKQK